MCILCFIRFFTPIMFVGRPTVYTMQCHRAGLFFTNTQGTHVLSSSIELRHCASLRASCQPSIPTSEVSAITLAHTWPTSHALLRLGKEHPNLLFFPRFLVLQRWSPRSVSTASACVSACRSSWRSSWAWGGPGDWKVSTSFEKRIPSWPPGPGKAGHVTILEERDDRTRPFIFFPSNSSLPVRRSEPGGGC